MTKTQANRLHDDLLAVGFREGFDLSVSPSSGFGYRLGEDFMVSVSPHDIDDVRTIIRVLPNHAYPRQTHHDGTFTFR